MPVTGQHDVMFMPWHAHFILTDHRWNIYALLYQKFGDIVLTHPGIWTPYPYAFYFLTSIWLKILDGFHLIQVANWITTWDVAYPARYVFLFKLLYLFFDLGVGIALYKHFNIKAWALWSWSSIVLYTPFLMGQNDIYATAFMAWGLCAASQAISINATGERKATSLIPSHWAICSAVLLGLGATFKLFPIILLPPVILVLERRWYKRLTLLLIGLIVLTSSIIPFLHTPIFFNEVLLNHEGVQLFREVTIFGINVSPFLVGYLCLCLFLFWGEIKTSSIYTPWLLGLAIFAWVFLWTPIPFYWLIWLMPMLCVMSARNIRFFTIWILLQGIFPLLVANQNQELGIALPIHLSPEFRLPNLITALAINVSSLSRLIQAGWPIISAGLVACFILCLVFSYQAFQSNRNGQPSDQFRIFPVVFIPIGVFFLIGLTNLIASSNLLVFNENKNWQEQSVTAGDILTQKLEAARPTINGLRLRVGEVQNAVIAIHVCLNRLGDAQPLVCDQGQSVNQPDDSTLTIVFKKPISLIVGEKLQVQLSVDSSSAPFNVYYDAANGDLEQNQKPLGSSLDIQYLYSFDLNRAFHSLVLQNFLGDKVLIGVWICVVVFTFFTLGWQLKRN